MDIKSYIDVEDIYIALKLGKSVGGNKDVLVKTWTDIIKKAYMIEINENII